MAPAQPSPGNTAFQEDGLDLLGGLQKSPQYYRYPLRKIYRPRCLGYLKYLINMVRHKAAFCEGLIFFLSLIHQLFILKMLLSFAGSYQMAIVVVIIMIVHIFLLQL